MDLNAVLQRAVAAEDTVTTLPLVRESCAG